MDDEFPTPIDYLEPDWPAARPHRGDWKDMVPDGIRTAWLTRPAEQRAELAASYWAIEKRCAEFDQLNREAGI